MSGNVNIAGDSSSVHDGGSSYDKERDFTTLKAWKHARTLKLFLYNSILVSLPADERFGLATQIRRAAVSCTANIAEGYGRYHYQEGIQFYRIARGSLYELKDHLITCLDLTYIDKEIYDDGIELLEEAKATLNGYIRFVKDQIANS